MEADIQYPYIPLNRIIRHVPKDNAFIIMAKEHARKHSSDRIMPTGAVIVKEGEVIAIGANRGGTHSRNAYLKIIRNIFSGQGFMVREEDNPRNHCEIIAMKNLIRGNSLQGSDIYVWGHWYSCECCWHEMIEAGIHDVYYMERSEVLYNKSHPENIIGKQFQRQ